MSHRPHLPDYRNFEIAGIKEFFAKGPEPTGGLPSTAAAWFLQGWRQAAEAWKAQTDPRGNQ